MSLPKNVWDQLKNKTADDLIRSLLRDGFSLDEKVRTEHLYRHPDGRRVTIHYHEGSRTYGPGLLKSLIADAGWNVSDMRRLKLIK